MVAADLCRYLENVYKDAAWQHGVIPGMVYVSQATETGSVYTLAELTAISEVCREYKLPLFLDGARLGYALMSEGSDMTLEDIARLCDVFYIGGTKVGALLGEAVVFSNAALAKHFFTIMKQGGAVLAKGRLLGLQFDTLFTDNLYMEISRHAIDMAMKLKHGLKAKGYTFFTDSPSNQQFIVLENEKMRELAKHVAFTQWALVDDDHTAIRLCTSWATTEETIDAVLSYL
jgi:threonine aldolase